MDFCFQRNANSVLLLTDPSLLLYNFENKDTNGAGKMKFPAPYLEKCQTGERLYERY
jgi:hypothetical protein